MWSYLRGWVAGALACIVAGVSFATPGPVRDQHVVAELVSSQRVVAPGETFLVALKLDHDEHWHTYWINPGTGYATSLKWNLPDGWTAGEILWPTPKLTLDRNGQPTGIGYEDTVFLLVELTAPRGLEPGRTVRLEAVADWLMCEVTCVPGNVTVGVDVVIGESSEADPQWGEVIARERAAHARGPQGWTISAQRVAEGPDRARIMADIVRVAGAPDHDPGKIFFFSRDAQIDYALSQRPVRIPGGWRLEMPADPAGPRSPSRFVGEWVAERGWEPGGSPRAIFIDVEYGAGGAPPAAAVSVTGFKLLATLGLALLGGLILNLMPCVFPVLGIKVLGFVQQAGSDRRKVVLHGLVFTLGVLVSFWLLAGVLLGLRAGGEQLGWGFQLQDPRFVFVLSVILLLVALNLSGLFEVGLSATSVGSELYQKGGFSGTFFSGVLATVVATPCSAPFLAPALGSALALPAATSILVFTCIALGLAAPYLLLSLFPSAVKILPRPGAWMETFKQVMAFPMYATVAFLVWLLAAQLEDFGLLFALLGMTLIAFGCWAYGRYFGAQRRGNRAVAGALAALALVSGGWLGWPKSGAPDIVWEPWSPEAVERHVADNRIIYVDFTARWCATCQTNKLAVFSSSEVKRRIERDRIVLLRADWTNRNAAITEELRRFGRSAIPFNLVYGPEVQAPVELPELLTPGIVLEAFDQVSPRRR